MNYDRRVKISLILDRYFDENNIDSEFSKNTIFFKKRQLGNVKLLYKRLLILLIIAVLLFLIGNYSNEYVDGVIKTVTIIFMIPIILSRIVIDFFKSKYLKSGMYLLIPHSNTTYEIVEVNLETLEVLESFKYNLSDNRIKIVRKSKVIEIIDNFISCAIEVEGKKVLYHNYFADSILVDRRRCKEVYKLYKR